VEFGRRQPGGRAVCGAQLRHARRLYRHRQLPATTAAARRRRPSSAWWKRPTSTAASGTTWTWTACWALAKAGCPASRSAQLGPTGTIQTTTDGDGRYQLFTPAPGLYTVSAAARQLCTPTSASPIPVPMGEDGGTVVDFGLHETPPAGFGVIAGRAWVDVDGSGFPEPQRGAAGRAAARLPTAGKYPLQTIYHRRQRPVQPAAAPMSVPMC
jgi:hypothetical protein